MRKPVPPLEDEPEFEPELDEVEPPEAEIPELTPLPIWMAPLFAEPEPELELPPPMTRFGEF